MQSADPPADVRDLRSSPRYVVRTCLSGTFGAADVEVCDISECGIQVRHNDSIRLGTAGRLTFSARGLEQRISLRGKIVWSHLAKTPRPTGRHPFYSGIRLDPAEQQLAHAAIQDLIRIGLATPDVDSLEAKRRRVMEKLASRRQGTATRQLYQTELSSDQVLMINHARERLRHNPDEARKWYMRAKFAAAEDSTRAREAPMHYREDVLAVWEYLERSVDLLTIVKVFEKQIR